MHEKGIVRCPKCGNIVYRMPASYVITGKVKIECGCGELLIVYANGEVKRSVPAASSLKPNEIKCPYCPWQFVPTGDDQFRLRRGFTINCPRCGRTIGLKPKIPAIEIIGETCAAPQKRKRAVIAPDGKSRWFVEADEKTGDE